MQITWGILVSMWPLALLCAVSESSCVEIHCTELIDLKVADISTVASFCSADVWAMNF